MSSAPPSFSGPGAGFADQAVDVRRYFDALRRSAWHIAAMALFVTAIVFALSHQLPKSYQATARIVYNPTTTLLQPTDATSTQRQLSTYQALVQAPTVAAVAARHLSESATTVRNAITSSADPSANLITITASGGTPRQATARANAVANAFLSEEQSMQNLGLNTARVQLQSQIAQLQGSPVVPGTSAQIAALRDRISALQINAAGTASELQIAEPAAPPTSASSPRPTLDAIVALFVSLLLGVLVVLARDQVRPRFSTPRELGRVIDLPVLSGIPYRRRFGTPRRRRALSGLEHEAYDALQATVRLLGMREGGQRTVLITSATHGEGKTTVTASLGRSLARAGQRTLLVSGDVRSPTLHEHFGLPASPGLVDVLQLLQTETEGPEETIEAMIRPAPGDLNLDVLPAGRTPSDPSSLMSGGALAVFMDAARRLGYEYILLDAPPVLGLGDSQFLARLADEVLLVARLDRVSQEQAEDIDELMKRLKLSPLGLVVVGARAELSPYYLADRPLAAHR